MTPTNSQNDVAKLVANVQALISQGAKAIVMAPQDTGAIAPTLHQLERQEDPGRHRRHPARQGQGLHGRARRQPGLRREGLRVPRREARRQGQGRRVPGRAGLDQRPRPLRGVRRLHEDELPRHHGLRRADRVGGRQGGRRAADPARPAPRHQGHLHAGRRRVPGADAAGAASTKNLLVPPDDPKHVFIVSNDGIPQELEAIRKGEIDATVSQPADLYAKYALFYAKAAIEGKTFQPGPTDHDSTIIEVRQRLLEDQLPAPLVTKDNVDDHDALGQPDRQVMASRRRAAGRRPATPAPVVEARRRHQALRPDRRARRRRHRRSRAGETHALVGRNGAGKSTLVSILTGLQRPDAGEVRFAGEPAPPLADRDGVAAAGRLRLPALDDHPDADRRREPVPQPADRAGGLISWRRAAPARPRELLERVRRRRRPGRAWPATSTSSSASSWRSPGRCRSAPGSSSSTSRPPSSTAPPSSGCSTGMRGAAASRA